MKQTKIPGYYSWSGMKSRCYCTSYASYFSYGGSGITVCDRWRNSFENFMNDMGPRPENHSIDRLDNNKGYYPENCRWATSTQQNRNKRIGKNNTSGITGIFWSKHKKKWDTHIRNNGKLIHLGVFNNIFDAACARKSAELKYFT